MRRIVAGLAAAALSLAALAAPAQAYPTRAVQLVVPAAAGGTIDILARTLAPKLAEGLGQPVIVENRPGAGTNIGMEAVVRASPDGHAAVIGGVPVATNKTLYTRLAFDPAKDLAPVSLLVTSGNVLVVNPSLPVGSVKELIGYARSRPGELHFGSPSTGSTPHLAGELFNTLAGVKMVHVPYKGAAQGLNDLIGGRLQLSFDNIPPAIPHVRSGKLRALAVTSSKRSALLPELPTVAEAGLPGFDVSAWFGLLVPAATPAPVVQRLHAETVKALSDAAVRERLERLGFEVVGGAPAEFAAHIRKEAERWSRIIRESGAKAD
jgi:tripartite-type tricarboxylate transporter receptor subunit TctC